MHTYFPNIMLVTHNDCEEKKKYKSSPSRLLCWFWSLLQGWSFSDRVKNHRRAMFGFCFFFEKDAKFSLSKWKREETNAQNTKKGQKPKEQAEKKRQKTKQQNPVKNQNRIKQFRNGVI